MTDNVFTPERRGIGAWFSDVVAGARDMARSALSEAMSWDLYRWTVLALLTATFILVALSYGGIRSELAALREERATPAFDPAAITAEMAKQISDMQAVLVQAMSDMKTGLSGDLAKISTKIDTKLKPAPAQRSAPRPRPQ